MNRLDFLKSISYLLALFFTYFTPKKEEKWYSGIDKASSSPDESVILYHVALEIDDKPVSIPIYTLN